MRRSISRSLDLSLAGSLSFVPSCVSRYSTWVLQLTRAWWTTKSVVRCQWLRPRVVGALLARRDIQFYLKFFFAVNGALIAIVLIEWLGYGSGGTAAGNATSMASFYFDWQPEYFLTATVICMQKTVEISVVKALLRTTMIAVGGALGYATMLNGTLASNAYFVFFIVVAVNGFFGLFSVYGMDFRYSLFLMVYTFNGVVACQYVLYSTDVRSPQRSHSRSARSPGTRVSAATADRFSSLAEKLSARAWGPCGR